MLLPILLVNLEKKSNEKCCGSIFSNIFKTGSLARKGQTNYRSKISEQGFIRAWGPFLELIDALH